MNTTKTIKKLKVSPEAERTHPDTSISTSTSITYKSPTTCTTDDDDFIETQSKFLTSLPDETRNNFFSDHHVDPERRAEIWERQAAIGEDLVNRFSWATPDARALKIIGHFGPVIEIGCGANAYWARRMCRHGIDVIAFDSHLDDGGKIMDGATEPKKESCKRKSDPEEGGNSRNVGDGLVLRKGGPDVLSSDRWWKDGSDQARTLFLCYPDEDLSMGGTNGDSPQSMATECLKHFRGDTIIHVGELFGDTLTMDHAPWGRSSGPEFQERLAGEYHCLLRATVPNWLHARDTISVWKRTQRCSIVFQGDGDGDSDCEDEYRYIPPDETLPNDLAAPSVKHLLSS